jgi:His-Xaa-Ser system radical SAM maturase HxsC
VPSKFDYLADGDILGFHPHSKRFRTLYRRSSVHNSFLVTERCNHYCLMCSQPPRDVEDSWILREIRDALPLVDKHTQSSGFTGGEPLLDWQDFMAVLSDCRDVLPQTAIHVLSNGRAFASTEVVAAWAGIQHPNLTVGIPIYSAVDTVHDYVVQAKGAFDETVLGILKLKNSGQRVEVRVVLHAITAPKIVATCKWLARNLPFVDHVALMGLENTGFAIANDKILWIDPVDYREQLAEAVHILAASKVRISVYNLQRCVLSRSVWPYAAQSISDWKNAYTAECASCDEKSRCSGFFTTGRPRYSRGIRRIVNMAPH